VPAATPAARPGTYAVDRPAGAPSEALLGFGLPASDEAARGAATSLAAALAGEDGLLAHALGADAAGRAAGRDEPLARTWDATVLGAPRARTLVVRVVASDDALDGAVAQVRGLLDRVRQGAFRDEDLRRASLALARARLATTLDPRARALSLWRGDLAGDGKADAPPASPSLDAVRGLAGGSLREDAMVVVAARPPRAEPQAPRGAPQREPKAK
jgi:hypothetical protein